MLVSTTEDVFKVLTNMNLNFKYKQAPKDLESFVSPAPQTFWNGYEMNYTALKNTLNYCIDKLKLKFKLLIICNGKYHSHIDVVPKTSPKDYLKYLRQLNPKLKWPKNFTYKNQKLFVDKNIFKNQNLRFMNCIVSKVKVKEDEDLFYIKRIKAVNERYNLPDGIYVLAPTDTLILRKDGKEPWVDVVGGEKKMDLQYQKFLPIFNGNSGIKYLDIPLPNYEDLQYLWNKEIQGQMNQSYAWDKKIDKAVFRGSATGCGFTYNRNMRLKATLLGKKYPQYLDAGITAMKEKLKIDEIDRVGYTDLKKLNIKFAKKLDPYEQSRYKYILHLDGNVAAHRLAKFFLLNSVTLICETGSTLWFSHMLIPYTHYVPVKKDLSDLIEQIKWCQKNDDKCRMIAQNSYDLGKKLLTEETCFSYITKTMWASRGVEF